MAHEPNGVLQAIEHTKHPFIIGVQWHPEFLLLHRRQRDLFRHLVEQARRPFQRSAAWASMCPDEIE